MDTTKVLSNAFVRLEPFEDRHLAGLTKAAADKAIWAHMISECSAPERFETWFQARLADQNAGKGVSYTIFCAGTGKIVGSSSFLAYVPEHKRVEIGHTWYAPPAQGTAINPACKLAMLAHAFDNGFHRVEFKTDSRNTRSRAALSKLGAVEEGILRAHMVVKGNKRRDSVYFSIINDDWPTVRNRLYTRLHTHCS